MFYDLSISIDGEDNPYPITVQRDKLSNSIQGISIGLTWMIKNKLLLKFVKDGRIMYASCDIKINCEGNETSFKIGVSKNASCGIEEELNDKVKSGIVRIRQQVCNDIVFSEKFKK